MAKRSPILGYNHNFRHRGLVFHVQTEDSGVNNPHIFTHLFNGGVILSTRKLTYDAGAADEVVKALMQAQHKAMLKDLKGGKFDEKISEYFGSDPKLDGGATLREMEDTEPTTEIPVLGTEIEIVDQIEELELELTDIELVDAEAIVSEEIEVITAAIEVVESESIDSDRIMPIRDGRRNPFDQLEISGLDGDPMDTLRGPAPPGPIGETPSGAVVIHAAAPDSAPQPPGANPTRPGQYAKHNTGKIRKTELEPSAELEPEPVPEPARVPDAAPAGKAASRDIRRQRAITQQFTSEPDAARAKENQSVIVGAPPQIIGQPTKVPTRPTRKAREPTSGSLFGKDLISEKSLDEVILAYLSEDGAGERE